MALKRFVADWVKAQVDSGQLTAESVRYPPAAVEPTNKKVAVVGSGPAGMTCALDLVRKGHSVTVYEALPVAGGMMRVGVPEYRMPYDLVQREVDDILAEGVELKLNTRVDDIPGLLNQGYDSVFVAVGAHAGIKLPIPGADLPQVSMATDFLRQVSLGESKNPQHTMRANVCWY
jgi:NADPH-dependent glutamate synthase beta subunit-like oxidoreductase